MKTQFPLAGNRVPRFPLSRTVLRLAASFTLAIAAGTATTPAYAVCDGCVVGAVGAAAVKISLAITVSTTALVKMITLHMISTMGATAGASYAITTAVSGAANSVAQSNISVQTKLEMARNEQRYDVAASDACSVLAPTMGISDAVSTGTAAYSVGGKGPTIAPGGSTDMAVALNVAERRTGSGAPEVELLRAAKGACSSFAQGDTLRGQSCTSAGFSAGNSSGFPNADVRATTLFDGPQKNIDPAMVVRRRTLELDGPDATAVRALQRNLDASLQLKQLTPAQLATEPGRQFIGLQDAFDARMSVARYPQDAQVDLMAAKKEFIPVLNQLMLSEDGPIITTYLKKNAPNWKTKGISTSEYLNLEVQRRMMNPQWHIRMAKSSPEENAKEQSRMVALQVWLSIIALQNQAVQSVVASNSAASQIRSEFTPQLIAAHNRATGR